MLTFYLSRHVKKVTGAVKWFGLVNSASMILAALALPMLGVICDRTGSSKRYLVWTTLVCIGLTALLSAQRTGWTILALFFLANLAYQTSLLFYNNLLPGLVRREREGLLSGAGIGLAYIGTIGTLLLTLQVVGPDADPMSLRWTFAVGAGVFLVFSLPALLWVPERPAIEPRPVDRGAFREELGKLVALLRELPGQRPMLLFLLGNFLLTDVLNTSIQCFAIYMEQVFALNNRQIMLQVAIPLNLAAFCSGILMGWLSDRFRAKYPMILAAFLLCAALLVAGVLAERRWFGIVRWVVILCGGMGLAGIWAAGRKCLLDLAPPDKLGAYFSLYVLSQKVSVIGSTVFFLLADLYGYRVAILSQALLLLPGVALILAFRYPERSYRSAA